MESLSKRGTWINGNRYKPGKRVLLETGDLIGVGEQTQMLFVAGGDDPDAALAVYTATAATRRNAFGKSPPSAAPAQAELEDEAAEAPEDEASEPQKPAKPARGRARRASEMSAGEREKFEQAARRRKIAIGLGIYLGLIAIVAVIGLALTGPGQEAMPIPPRMSDPQIEDALAELPPKTPNKLFMEDRLEEAMGLYQQYGLESPRLYECVYAFKQALAYSGRNFFENTEHERVYRQALRRLTEKVQQRYRNAYLHEKAQNWMRAEAAFRDLMAILTVEEDFERNRLFANVQAHHKRAKYFMLLKRPGRRGPWL